MANGAVARYDIWKTIVPSDTVNFDAVTPSEAHPECCDAIWCGTAGTVTPVMQNGTPISFTVVAGSILQIAAIRVNATGTAATLLVALYQK